MPDMHTTGQQVVLVTGASSGFGRLPVLRETVAGRAGCAPGDQAAARASVGDNRAARIAG